jgi:NlpC/P60 family.
MYDGEFTKDWYKVEPFRLIRYLAKHLDSTRDASELSFGDVCYFCINGEGHVGIYLEYGKILSTFPPDCQQWDGSILPDRSMVLHKSMWFKGFSAGFKRKR